MTATQTVINEARELFFNCETATKEAIFAALNGLPMRIGRRHEICHYPNGGRNRFIPNGWIVRLKRPADMGRLHFRFQIGVRTDTNEAEYFEVIINHQEVVKITSGRGLRTSGALLDGYIPIMELSVSQPRCHEEDWSLPVFYSDLAQLAVGGARHIIQINVDDGTTDDAYTKVFIDKVSVENLGTDNAVLHFIVYEVRIVENEAGTPVAKGRFTYEPETGELKRLSLRALFNH